MFQKRKCICIGSGKIQQPFVWDGNVLRCCSVFFRAYSTCVKKYIRWMIGVVHCRKREIKYGNMMLETQLLHLHMLMTTCSWHLITPFHRTGKKWTTTKDNPTYLYLYVYDDDVYYKSNPQYFRLLCVCSSSGSIRLLRVGVELNNNDNVVELARLDLQGDIFSSPVMIGGRIFVGCRDDYVHCIHLKL